MDEVGRGTTVKDGLAIAFATVHHLYSKNRCRTQFATHFHELTDMLGHTPDHKGEGFFEDIGFFCTDVDETTVRQSRLPFILSDFVSAGRPICLFAPTAARRKPGQPWPQGRPACRLTSRSNLRRAERFALAEGQFWRLDITT
jgi:hypothetical protein